MTWCKRLCDAVDGCDRHAKLTAAVRRTKYKVSSQIVKTSNHAEQPGMYNAIADTAQQKSHA